jgi:hypothetical protein
MRDRELDLLVHELEVENTELKAMFKRAVDIIKADEALLAQALDALEFHTAIKHPAQIPYRDRTIALLRTRLAPSYTPTPNEGSEP